MKFLFAIKKELENQYNLLDKNDIIENNGTIKKESIAGDVEFDNVSFAYNNIDHVLNNLNFKIKPKKTIIVTNKQSPIQHYHDLVTYSMPAPKQANSPTIMQDKEEEEPTRPAKPPV